MCVPSPASVDGGTAPSVEKATQPAGLQFRWFGVLRTPRFFPLELVLAPFIPPSGI